MSSADNPGSPYKEGKLSQSPCVDWPGSVNRKGYGVALYNGTFTTAARIAWMEAFGPIPEGLQIDHLCRNRRCVNVEHLELVTPKENTNRAPWTQVDCCPEGHPYTGDNLYTQTDSFGRVHRSCKVCRKRNSLNAEARRHAR